MSFKCDFMYSYLWNDCALEYEMCSVVLSILYIYTVETLYSTIPYTTIFYITRWTPKFTKADLDPNRVIRFLIKTNLRVICLFTARAVDSEWTHLWPATSVNNDGRTDYLRLSHFAALSAGVHNYLRCIHKGLKAFSRVTPPIRMHDQTILTWSFDPTHHHLMSAEVGSRLY